MGGTSVSGRSTFRYAPFKSYFRAVGYTEVGHRLIFHVGRIAGVRAISTCAELGCTGLTGKYDFTREFSQAGLPRPIGSGGLTSREEREYRWRTGTGSIAGDRKRPPETSLFFTGRQVQRANMESRCSPALSRDYSNLRFPKLSRNFAGPAYSVAYINRKTAVDLRADWKSETCLDFLLPGSSQTGDRIRCSRHLPVQELTQHRRGRRGIAGQGLARHLPLQEKTQLRRLKRRS